MVGHKSEVFEGWRGVLGGGFEGWRGNMEEGV